MIKFRLLFIALIIYFLCLNYSIGESANTEKPKSGDKNGEKEVIEKMLKQYPWSGAINSPGADSENLLWEKAREKETEHFRVKTNLSPEALNDICYTMESALLAWQKFFNLKQSKEKISIEVFKNQEEFKQAYKTILKKDPSENKNGVFIAEHPAKIHKSLPKMILCYYRISQSKEGTFSTLLHEGTHYAVSLCVKQMPIWLNEGLATYFESSEFKENKLVTNLIHQEELKRIKEMINSNNYLPMGDLINLADRKFNSSYGNYSQSWSLVYFLLNASEEKYKKGFYQYLEDCKKIKVIMRYSAKEGYEIVDKDGHIKLFEKEMGVAIDNLEKEWKEYIKNLMIK